MSVSPLTSSFWAIGRGAADATSRRASLVRPDAWLTAWVAVSRPSSSASLDANHRLTCWTISWWVSPSNVTFGMGQRLLGAATRVLPAVAPGQPGEQLAEHHGRRAPDGVADDVEEVEGAVEARHAPPLLVVHLVEEELLEWHVQDVLDLAGVGGQLGETGQQSDEGHDERPAHHRGQVVELA